MKRIFLFLLFFSLLVNAQIITTIAGNGSGSHFGDGGAAIAAGTPAPTGGAFDRYGNFYIPCQVASNTIRQIDRFGIITTVAGSIAGGFSGDGGQATAARLNLPVSVQIDSSLNIYICDAANHRIRKVNRTTGIISTIVGTGTAAFGGDGSPASAAQIYNPNDICLDKFGNLYIADLYNYRIRKVDASGIITTFAGTGTMGFSGDGGQATAADLNFPVGLASDDSGNVYIADVGSFASRVRKVSITTGIITTYAGNGGSTYIGDGTVATSTAINPHELTFDLLNNLYISDLYNNRVYKVENTTGILYHVAGNGIAADTGDGNHATAAAIYRPGGVAIDPCGNLYIPAIGSLSVAGSGNRIRKVSYAPNPFIAVSGPITIAIGSTITVAATIANAGVSYTIKWLNRGIPFATTTTPSVTYTKTQCSDSITAVVYGCGDSAVSAVHVVGCNVGIASPPVPLSINGEEVTCYPNPTGEVLYITALRPVESVIITNLLGQAVITATYNNTNVQIDMKHLPAGLYFVRVNGLYVQRVVKE